MTSAMSDQEESRDAFENCFSSFVSALQILAMDADEQCDVMGNYNTPYEIKLDVSGGGLGSLRMSVPHLNWEQAEAVLDLVAEVRRLPDDALYVPNLSMTTAVGCVTAMNHPAWRPLRARATELLMVLGAAIDRNAAYFSNQA